MPNLFSEVDKAVKEVMKNIDAKAKELPLDQIQRFYSYVSTACKQSNLKRTEQKIKVICQTYSPKGKYQ